MSHYASIRSPAVGGRGRRSGLLGVVLTMHAGVLVLLMASRTAPVSLSQAPLMVEFFTAPKPLEIAAPPAAKAAPTAKPRPVAQALQRAATARTPPVPRAVAPVLESATRSDPAPDNAPVVAAPAAAPAPASAPAGGEGGPGGSGGNGGNSGNVGNGTGDAGGAGEGALSGARFDADYLRNPAPPYPPQSRRLGEEGRTLLRVFVGADGSARQVEVRTTSGSSRLDDSALRTVRGWKFVPARRGGVAVDSWVLVPIVFKLEQ